MSIDIARPEIKQSQEVDSHIQLAKSLRRLKEIATQVKGDEMQSEHWFHTSDGNFLHFSINQYEQRIRMTLHPDQRHESYDYQDNAIGNHFTLTYDRNNEFHEIQSHDTEIMRKQGLQGYVKGDHYHLLKDAKEHSEIREALHSGFPVQGFIDLVNSIDSQVS